jgi:dTDP-4-amino-4,6-dideoxygalactose transaminase
MQPAHNKLYVGRPNIGSRESFIDRVNKIFDSRWLSNDGPFVREFEQSLANMIGVKHVIAMCNATVAIEIACRALNFTGEVILPSYTFIATAHALKWQGISPVFCDIDPKTHNIAPDRIAQLITPNTSGIIGVHVWGRPCDTTSIAAIAEKHNLPVMYDASHAFACSHQGQMIGNFGKCEVFSFHATKFINCFEGGAVTTNDDELAEKMRLMRNFGFIDFDKVVYLGINGKMSEISAAMGITSLESIDEFISINKHNYESYHEELSLIPGIKLLHYDSSEKNNFQYIVAEIDPELFGTDRDSVVSHLHANNIIARKYFWPGCHRMEPYRSLNPLSDESLGETNRLAARLIVLPTGQTVDKNTIKFVCKHIKECLTQKRF